MNLDLTEIKENNPYFQILWNVSDVCNYKCTYCDEHSNGGKNPNLSTINTGKILEEIFQHFHSNGIRAVKVFFTGGEPSYWPLLPDICQTLLDLSQKYQMQQSIGMNTNLSRPLSWWEKNINYFKDISASFHVEFADPIKFLEKIKFLERRSNLIVRMMMQKDNFQKIKETGLTFESEISNCTIEYAHILDNLGSGGGRISPLEEADEIWMSNKKTFSTHNKDYDLRKINHSLFTNMISKNGKSQSIDINKIISTRSNNFQGWECDISKCIEIHHSGSIRLATGTCGALPPIGNMQTGHISFPKSLAISCPKSHCHCGIDITIPKRKIHKHQASNKKSRIFNLLNLGQ